MYEYTTYAEPHLCTPRTRTGTHGTVIIYAHE